MPSTYVVEQYSPWVGLIYVFNIIVGTGALTLPAAFVEAGWLLSFILITMLAFFGYVTVTFIVESISCANATIEWTKIKYHRVDGESEVFDETCDEDHEATEETAMTSRIQRRYYSLNQKIELGEMATLYFNKVGRTLFYVALCVYLYGDLAIYPTVVAKTLANLVCNTSDNGTIYDSFEDKCFEGTDVQKITVYRGFVLLFAILVGPFSYFNVQRTKYLQICTSTMRWCAFTIMITIAIVKISKNDSQGSPPMVQFDGVPALVGASVYSFMCHHSLPSLVAPFANKRYVIRQLGVDYLLICIFYLLLAITGSFAFSNISDLYTLNFVPSSLNMSGVFFKIIEYFLGLFPVFTLSTSFPIIAITLQNNLKSLFLDVNSMDRYNFVLRRLTFPTIVVVPAIIVSLLTHNIRTLVEVTGSFAGAAIQYVMPAALVWCARHHCSRSIGGLNANKYASPFKSIIWILIVMCWSFMCIVLVTLNLLSS